MAICDCLSTISRRCSGAGGEFAVLTGVIDAGTTRCCSKKNQDDREDGFSRKICFLQYDRLSPEKTASTIVNRSVVLMFSAFGRRAEDFLVVDLPRENHRLPKAFRCFDRATRVGIQGTVDHHLRRESQVWFWWMVKIEFSLVRLPHQSKKPLGKNGRLLGTRTDLRRSASRRTCCSSVPSPGIHAPLLTVAP